MTVRLVADTEHYDSVGKYWPREIVVVGSKEQVEYFIQHCYMGVEQGTDPFLQLAEPTYYCGAQYCDEPECGTHGINYKLWRES